jgi:hypothetical protein
MLLGACGGGTEKSEQKVQAPKVIVAIGDSETAGAVSTNDGFVNMPEASYPAVLQSLYGNSVIVKNLGVNSSNLLEVVEQQLPKAVLANPDILLVSTTLNDAGDKLTPEQLTQAYSKIKSALPTTRIILLTPLRAGSDVMYIDLYYKNLWKYGFEVIDVRAKQQDSWYCGNTDIHPCEYGYAEMAKVVYTYLGKL